MDRGRIRGLDGLRAIAVTLVFLHHNTGLGQYNVGSYGVWLFFVLSGFLIIRILQGDRKNIEAGQTGLFRALRGFMSRRILRIFPVYYVTLILTLPLYARTQVQSGVDLHISEAAYNFLYLSNIWIGNLRQEWVGPFSHLWSLSIEEQFYLLAPLLFLLTPSRHSARLCLVILGVGMAARLYLEWNGAPLISLYTNSLVNFTLIAYGGFCALHLDAFPLLREKAGAFAAPLALAAYLALPFLLQAAGVFPGGEDAYQYPALLVGPLLFFIAGQQRQWLVAALELWPLRSLGKISYGFYLFHNFAGIFVEGSLHVLSRMSGVVLAPPAWLEVVMAFVVTVSAATLSWHFLEKPLLGLRPRTAGKAAEQSSPA